MQTIFQFFNGRNHSLYLKIFSAVLTLHLLEHIFQAFQFFVLNWSRQESLGFLGLWFPWLIRSEGLHYFHALFMLIGLFLLKPAVTNQTARIWWNICIVLAFLHHLEHFLLLEQAITKTYLFVGTLPIPPGKLGVPISLGQVFFPKLGLEIFRQRIELHLFYNLVVMFPMMISLKLQKFKYK